MKQLCQLDTYEGEGSGPFLLAHHPVLCWGFHWVYENKKKGFDLRFCSYSHNHVITYKRRYRSKLMRGSGGLALSTGYRSLTAILTSSASAVRNLSRFRMVYSWSARMMLPWKRTRAHQRTSRQASTVFVRGWYDLNSAGRVFLPCHRVQWLNGRQPHLNQTGCQQSCQSQAV